MTPSVFTASLALPLHGGGNKLLASPARAVHITSAFLGMLVVVQVGCAPGVGSPQNSAAPSGDDGATKTLVLAQATLIKVLGPWGTSNTAGGGATLMAVHSTGLVSLDTQGNQVGRIAVALPSLDDGSLVLLPDGRMRTTWRLRPDVTWQDGAPFTAEDVVFSHQLATDPGLPGAGGISGYIERVEAVDPYTVAIIWKTTYYNALFLDFRSFWLLPRHLLAQTYEEGNKEAFLNEPYFTTDYVNLGPFRMVDWGLGQQLTFERYTRYFLGVPKIGRIIIQAVADQNVMAAGLRAGTIDVIAEKALDAGLSLTLRDEWSRSSEGTVVSRPTNWYYLQFQWDPQWARPPEVPRDVRLRIGLYEAIDRAALREFLFPGVPDTNADTFMPAGDTRGAIVGQPFARYGYDPARAARDLVEGGWSRTADGRFLDRAGNPAQLEIWAGQADTPPMAVVAAEWRKIGVDTNEFTVPAQLLAPTPERTRFPGPQLTARGVAENVFPNFDGRELATAQNRWTGANRAGYTNPALDRLIDQLYSALDFTERGGLLKQMAELLAEDLPALPAYWQINFLEIRNTVRGPLADDYQHQTDSGGQNLARNAHLWERAGPS